MGVGITRLHQISLTKLELHVTEVTYVTRLLSWLRTNYLNCFSCLRTVTALASWPRCPYYYGIDVYKTFACVFFPRMQILSSSNRLSNLCSCIPRTARFRHRQIFLFREEASIFRSRTKLIFHSGLLATIKIFLLPSPGRVKCTRCECTGQIDPFQDVLPLSTIICDSRIDIACLWLASKCKNVICLSF